MSYQIQTSLKEEEQFLLYSKLFQLLEKQTRRFTSGESSSIPAETGRELMHSIIFCIGVALYGEDYNGEMEWKSILSMDFERLWEQGREWIVQKLWETERLWKEICDILPPVKNRSMEDTLKSIGTFFQHYDYRFFAHEIPCDIDYQLSIPISEKEEGVLYVSSYLNRMALENIFVSKFGKKELNLLFCRYCTDYRELLINLYEPVAVNATACALLGKDPGELLLTKQEQKILADMFEHVTKTETETMLSKAADTVLEQMSCVKEEEQMLMKTCMKNLTARVLGVRDVNGLTGIFL